MGIILQSGIQFQVDPLMALIVVQLAVFGALGREVWGMRVDVATLKEMHKGLAPKTDFLLLKAEVDRMVEVEAHNIAMHLAKINNPLTETEQGYFLDVMEKGVHGLSSKERMRLIKLCDRELKEHPLGPYSAMMNRLVGILNGIEAANHLKNRLCSEEAS